MAKNIVFNSDAREKIRQGVNVLGDAVRATMGPKGRNAILERTPGSPLITNDGVTIAKEIELIDNIENMGAQIVKEAAIKTNDEAGDGPQPLYSKILTPNGWTTMGEIKKGDVICGTNNTHQTVLEVYPKGKKELVIITFSNGKQVHCCQDHLWTISTSYGKRKTMTTREMINKGVYKLNSQGDKRYNFYTPSNTVEFEEKELPIHPYLLGVLLGDGSLTGTGNIELSLGYNKEHIIEKIYPILPDNIQISIQDCLDKNCYRVKFSKIDKTNPISMESLLNELNLLGTNSKNKFIPEIYLYNSVENRTQLLNGLIDTDGYNNNRGLFEFSTVSDKLNESFTELVNSLGIQTSYTLHKRDNDLLSYSFNPIHRHTQLKGYKYGIKIVDIEVVNKLEEMKCIKVSNEDNLYITDGYIVTHNTTTATVLAQAIINEGYNALSTTEDVSEEEKNQSIYKGANPVLLKKGIEIATKIAIDELKAIAKPIETDEEIKQIATISSASDDIGELISQAIKRVGKDGIITTTESHTIETTLEVKEGFEFDRGFYSPYFADDQEKIESVFYNPLILVSDQKMRTQQEIVPLLEQVLKVQRPIVFIVDEIEQIVFSSLLRNKMNGNMDVAVIKAPGFGAKRKELLQDIAILTGATFISEEYALTMSEARINLLGSCESIKITKNNTIIFNGYGDKEEINKRAEHIKNSINADNISEYDKEKLEERLAKITGGIATIKIGAATEPELKEKKLRIEDAINATKAAIEEGIVAGGGTALFNLSPVILEKTKNLVGDVYQGALCVALAVNSPIIQIAMNAGVNATKVMENVLKTAKEKSNPNIGYDAYNDAYVDMLEAGIIDPVKVTRNALQNAASVAAILLTTDVTISNFQ